MTSVTTDRRLGVNASAAVKVPCKAATTANITLSGEQTIDGVSIVDGDRVLVKDQTTASENGIYDADTGSWSRSKDWDGTYDIVKGTLVRVTDGTLYSDSYWAVSTSNTITIGTTSVSFSQSNNSLSGVSAFVETVLDDTDADAVIETLADGATAETSPATGDIVFISDVSANDGRKMTLENMLKVINALTAETAFDPTTDYVVVYNASASAVRKALLNSIPANGTIPVPTNARISPSVASSALTIALKGNDGNDPSATNRVYIPFRSSTAGTGSLTWRSVTAALSTVISSGSTAGHASAQNHYIYVYALDNAGTVELAWSTLLYDDGSVQTTTAEGGAGAADSATTLYSTTARTDVPIRLISRMLSNQTTAGTWAAVPTEVTPYPWSNREFRSQIRLHSGNGHGSTNTKIRRFTTVVENAGSDITYADSAANGSSFTITRDGIYAMSYSDSYSAGGITYGISLNSGSLTTDLASIAEGDVVAIANSSTGATSNASITIRLRAGDVIRPHTNGTPDNTGTLSRFSITRVA